MLTVQLRTRLGGIARALNSGVVSSNFLSLQTMQRNAFVVVDIRGSGGHPRATRTGRFLKVADLGVSSGPSGPRGAEGRCAITRSHCGTPSYIAPEILKAAGAASPGVPRVPWTHQSSASS